MPKFTISDLNKALKEQSAEILKYYENQKKLKYTKNAFKKARKNKK